jgi:hypothetical protein
MKILLCTIATLSIFSYSVAQDNNNVSGILNKINHSMRKFECSKTDSLLNILVSLDSIAIEYLISQSTDTTSSYRFCWFGDNPNFFLQPKLKNNEFYLFIIHAMYNGSVYFVQTSPQLVFSEKVKIASENLEHFNFQALGWNLAKEWSAICRQSGGLVMMKQLKINPFLNSDTIDWKFKKTGIENDDPFMDCEEDD